MSRRRSLRPRPSQLSAADLRRPGCPRTASGASTSRRDRMRDWSGDAATCHARLCDHLRRTRQATRRRRAAEAGELPERRVINANFESWEPARADFDAILAFTAFHRVSPEMRYTRAAELLRHHGKIAIVSTTSSTRVFDPRMPAFAHPQTDRRPSRARSAQDLPGNAQRRRASLTVAIWGASRIPE